MESVLNISAHKYGNYHKYYTFHPSLTRSEIFLKYSKNLFYILWKNQNYPKQFVILDIGCNEGNLSVEILNQARLQIPSYVTCILLGIDIDKNLINLANNKYCHHYYNHDNSQNNKEIDTISDVENDKSNNTFIYFHAIDFMNIQLTNEYFIQFFHMIHIRLNSGNNDTHIYKQQQQEQELCDSHQHLLNQHENSQCKHNDNSNNYNNNKFNIISLFSITMWIHLNHGDDGLIGCLTRSVSYLHTNGSLIIEPQLWKCYKNNNKRCRKLGIERTTLLPAAAAAVAIRPTLISTTNNIDNNNYNNSNNYFHVLKIRDDIDKHIIEILTNLSDNNNDDNNNVESLTSTPCIKHKSIESSIASTTVIDESSSVSAKTDIITVTTSTSSVSNSNNCSRKIIKSYWNLGKENWGRSILIFHKSTTPIITSTDDDDDDDNDHIESDVFIHKEYKRCKTE
jgi:hypothetical protein